MSLPSSNQELFDGAEFDTWVDLNSLFPDEVYLIDRYLQPDLKTVEAGTNGGRILFQLRAKGFSSLAGFDYVPKLIDAAIARDVERTIDFAVGDAVALTYADNSFDQIIYLQQIICLIENESDRLQAVREAYRILKPGGTGIFSVLSFEARRNKASYSTFLTYLSALRKLRGDNRSIQYQPWLIVGGKYNFSAIADRPPYVYWYTTAEIERLLRLVGFEIVAIGSSRQISAQNLQTFARDIPVSELDGMLYVAVKK